MKQRTDGRGLRYRRKRQCRRLGLGMIVLAGSLQGMPVQAAASAPATVEYDWAEEQFSVQELMRMETRQALLQQRRKMPITDTDGTARGSDGAEFSAPVLAAIYGVGKHLTAEVRWGQQVVRLRQGEEYERLAGDRRQSYVLQAFRLPCIALDDNGTSLHLCLPDWHNASGQKEKER